MALFHPFWYLSLAYHAVRWYVRHLASIGIAAACWQLLAFTVALQLLPLAGMWGVMTMLFPVASVYDWNSF